MSQFPEFDVIDSNGGGQILFGEFIQWAISKDLDIAVDKDWKSSSKLTKMERTPKYERIALKKIASAFICIIVIKRILCIQLIRDNQLIVQFKFLPIEWGTARKRNFCSGSQRPIHRSIFRGVVVHKLLICFARWYLVPEKPDLKRGWWEKVPSFKFPLWCYKSSLFSAKFLSHQSFKSIIIPGQIA